MTHTKPQPDVDALSPPAPPAWSDWLQQAIDQHRHYDLEEAERLYRQVLDAEPGQPDALHFLGVLRHQQGHSDEAIELIEAALRAIPKHADAHNNLGNVHRECGHLAEAEACYRRALACSPGHPDALGNLAVVLEVQGHNAEAFVTYGAFLKTSPECARAYYLMGLFLRNHAQNLEHAEQAIGLFREAIALDPALRGARSALGICLYGLKRQDEAREVYREWLARDPDNPTPRHLLAASGGAPAPARADDAYVRQEFDGFAASFDRQLLENLNYHAPQVLADALAGVLPPGANPIDVLDAGCGTGLCAPLLRPLARRLAGVDLSPLMLAKARQRGGYDELVEAELTAFLQAHAAAYDAVVSADTLVYFGDLTAFMAAAHGALRAGGWLVFSLEAMEGDAFELSPSGRYRHSRAYVDRVLLEAGFVDARIQADSLRREGGKPVASWVVLARVPGGVPPATPAGAGKP